MDLIKKTAVFIYLSKNIHKNLIIICSHPPKTHSTIAERGGQNPHLEIPALITYIRHEAGNETDAQICSEIKLNEK